MKITSSTLRGLPQLLQIELIIHLSSEDRVAIVAALDDVLGLAGNDIAWQTGNWKFCSMDSFGQIAEDHLSIEPDPVDSHQAV